MAVGIIHALCSRMFHAQYNATGRSATARVIEKTKCVRKMGMTNSKKVARNAFTALPVSAREKKYAKSSAKPMNKAL